jgi:L,D-transpeptidase ErfK/SrfK
MFDGGLDVLDQEATKQMLLEAIRGDGPSLVLPMREVPVAPEAEVAIVVRLSDFRLDLYNGTDIVRDYPVGIGKINYPTPTGAFYVASKARNPTWWNPGSAWARGMPRYMPPGPRNPLGTRALRLDRDAIVIHGTPQPNTIGTRASHGCVRMLREDVEELFELVPEGTAVFILP